jgi:predicted transcriptional regulator
MLWKILKNQGYRKLFKDILLNKLMEKEYFAYCMRDKKKVLVLNPIIEEKQIRKGNIRKFAKGICACGCKLSVAIG